MAEVKNAFIQSKMNKDLDDRLLPSGEYRNAVNAQVSKSEGSDVGALENVLGNALIADFTPIVATATVSNVFASIGIGVQSVSAPLFAGYKVITNNYIDNITVVDVSNYPDDPKTYITFSSAVNFSIGQTISFAPNLSSIGYLSDEFSNSIYIFLTDNTTNSYVPSGPGSNHYIYKYDAGTNSFTKLVEGAFLNFSKLNPIFGVNLLEDLLFWTDNRNQPRKINVQNPLGYYTKEEHLSVAKYYPYKAIDLYSESTLVLGEYESTMKDVVSKSLPNGGSATCSLVNNLTTFPINNLSILVYPNEPLNGFTIGYFDVSGNIQTLDATVVSYTEPNITLSSAVNIPLIGDATELVFNVNPYYENDYPGDESFLEDKFVRFSYRFRFDDGEYSLLAPFTQVCFIPKQDGYFLNTTLNDGDEKQAIESTVVEFMENKVNKINLQIPLPCDGQDLLSEFHITDIDIIYKESDGLALQVVETIPVESVVTNLIQNASANVSTNISNNTIIPIDNVNGFIKIGDLVLGNDVLNGTYVVSVSDNSIIVNKSQTLESGITLAIGSASYFNFTYNSQKPYKTLPSNEITRVYDKVPVKALAQEIISNRVVYGNYLDKIDPPASLDYNVAATQKYEFSLLNNFTSSIEYPNSSLKTNRNYQVGIVLADKFGRQSTVVLSNNKDTITVGGISYSGSTLYSPYINEGIDEDAWLGNSLKILFNEVINQNVYNGNIFSLNYNPIGWYSYKVVVKQTEQDYYNIYTAGALKGTPSDTGLTSTSYISLINDNINKVPRDLSEVGPTQTQFRSSVKLYGRVENVLIAESNIGNKQFFPGKTSFTTSTIQNLFDIFDYDSTSPVTDASDINVIYKALSNPSVGQITTSQNSSKQFGVINGSGPSYITNNNLAVFETDPDTSRLDIFWETSTSGTIEELNEAISQENPSASNFSSFDTDLFDEGIEFGEDILTTDFYLVDFFGVAIPVGDISSFNLTSVLTTDTTPQNVTNYFELYEPTPGSKNYNIKVTSNFLANVYYGNQSSKRIWNFNFTAVVNGSSSTIQKTVSLLNLPPVIYVDPYTPAEDFSVNKNPSNVLIATLKATNGASIVDGDNLNTGKDLTWSIKSQTRSNGLAGNYFVLSASNTDIISTCELINNQVDSIIPDTYTIVLRVTDAGGALDEITITANMGVQILPGQVRNVEIVIQIYSEYNYDYDYVTILEVTESNIASQNGVYLFSQAWGNLGEGGGPVEIDYTNAIKDDSCATSEPFWYFADTGDASVDTYDLISYLVNCFYVNVEQWQFYETVVDTSDNTFYIT
jgi:hypothetical protein